MKTCKNCGKEVAEEFKYCNSCGAEIEEVTDENVDIESIENTAEQPEVNEYQNIQPADSNDEYLPLISNSKTTNLISIGLLAVGVISLLFINGWLGAILCFVAEIVAVIPNTKVQKLFKSKNPTMDKKSFKTNLKELQNDLKAKSKDFKLSFLLALIALVLLVVFVVTDSAIASWADSLPADLQKDGYGSGIVEQIDTISDLHQYSNTDMYNYSRDDDSEKTTDNSEQGSSNNHSVEPVVGSFDYSESYYSDTMEKITVSLPYISHINFEADGTGNLTQKTNTSPGFALYETTWEVAGNTNGIKGYDVHTTNTNETICVFYDSDRDICYTVGIKNGRYVMNIYKRYSGNAQENISGGKATTSQDIIGSYNFSYAYNSNTEYKTTTPSIPYIYSLAFYDGGSCLVTTKNSSGLDFLYGSWKYNEPVGESFEYTITHSEGTFALLYFPDYETVGISDNSGMRYYFEKDKD
ncbi:MAG: zinc ribbon domain-containing protein [Clostridia bacterium]|nr:zinc ribbon domain-containing protein [Clostridia bacterium]